MARSPLTDAEKDLRGIVKATVDDGAAAAEPGAGSALGAKGLNAEEACPGALGWVCAACWCVGCAALCAQPLLLQAELAGRRQRTPSVALLAGVCTYLWLMARMSGGALLQLGTAAQAVCAAPCLPCCASCWPSVPH